MRSVRCWCNSLLSEAHLTNSHVSFKSCTIPAQHLWSSGNIMCPSRRALCKHLPKVEISHLKISVGVLSFNFNSRPCAYTRVKWKFHVLLKTWYGVLIYHSVSIFSEALTHSSLLGTTSSTIPHTTRTNNVVESLSRIRYSVTPLAATIFSLKGTHNSLNLMRTLSEDFARKWHLKIPVVFSSLVSG